MKENIKQMILELWEKTPKDWKSNQCCVDHAPSWIPEEGKILKPQRLAWLRRKMDNVDNLYIWTF